MLQATARSTRSRTRPRCGGPRAGTGRYNIPNIGIFLWRLQPFRLRGVAAGARSWRCERPQVPRQSAGRGPAAVPPAATEADIEHLAEPVNVPDPLARALMAPRRCATRRATDPAVAVSDDYGAGGSVVISRARPTNPAHGRAGAAVDPQARSCVRIADLRDVSTAAATHGWSHEDDVREDQIASIPSAAACCWRGARRRSREPPILATFHYGSRARSAAANTNALPASVADHAAQQLSADGAALQPHARRDRGAGGRLLIEDSLTYARDARRSRSTASPTRARPGSKWWWRAAQRRPAADRRPAATSSLEIGARGTLVLEGSSFSGGALQLAAAADDEPRDLVLRDCTLVPGLALDPDGDPCRPGAPSLVVEHPFAKVTLERCITGPLIVVGDAEVELADCIVDAGAPESVAYAADATGARRRGTHASSECTVIGKLHTKLLQLASNSIFFARSERRACAPLVAERRQEGCMRFCYVPPGSVTPRRYPLRAGC